MSNLSEGMTGFIYTTFGNVENVLYLSSMKETKYPGYFVNEMGEVFSNKQGSLKKLKPVYNKSCGGYYYVKISQNSKAVSKSVHRLVAETYIPNVDNKETVNHKNLNKLDNRVENLEWSTRKEQMQHLIDNQKFPSRNGENNPNSVLTKKDIILIKYLRYELGWSYKQITKNINKCSQSTIEQVCRDKTWRNMNG
jgi:hypothetical protein